MKFDWTRLAREYGYTSKPYHHGPPFAVPGELWVYVGGVNKIDVVIDRERDAVGADGSPIQQNPGCQQAAACFCASRRCGNAASGCG